MIKILITEPKYFPEEQLNDLRSLGTVTSKNFTDDQLIKEINDFDVILVRARTKIDKKLLDAAQKLKIIGSPTTGIDHIDMKTATERRIKIFNSPGMNTNAVAEHTFALILSLARKLPWAVNKKLDQRQDFIGFEIKGKTIGIIGFGRIGKRISELANSFSMEILTYDPYVSKEDAKKFNAEMVDLELLIKNSDIISINALLTEETKGIIDKKLFNLMKRSAILINTSREQLVDTASLLHALQNNIIAGAALDVYEENPNLSDYATKNKNLILTPHIAGSTIESINEATRNVIQLIKKELGQNGN